MSGVDMAKVREEHGLAQAHAETRAVAAIANRFGTVSYKQGHKRGFWDGVQFALENLAQPEAPAPARAPQGELTVVEFAAKHCAEHGEFSPASVSAHVNGIILAAVTRNRTLWEVGVDADGRASLIWVSLPEPVWESLLAEGSRLQLLLSLLGDLP
jgi:hypothetical protein